MSVGTSLSVKESTNLWLLEFVAAHSFWLVVVGLVVVLCWDYYTRFLQINRKTGRIDLMGRYIELQMRRRYRGPKV
jgi:hypothetical protein